MVNLDATDALREARIGLELMIQADEAGDREEFKAQALHLGEHFESLDNALRSGGDLPTDWQVDPRRKVIR